LEGQDSGRDKEGRCIGEGRDRTWEYGGRIMKAKGKSDGKGKATEG